MTRAEALSPGTSQRVFVSLAAAADVRRFDIAVIVKRDDPQHRIAVDLDRGVLTDD